MPSPMSAVSDSLAIALKWPTAAASASNNSTFKLVAVAYDSEGSIMGTGESSIYAQRFSGFDVFSMTVHAADIGILATRIRVFPKAY